MVAVITPPHAHPLAQQKALFVVVFARPDHKDRIWSAGLAKLQHLDANFFERLIPGDALVFAIHQLHGVTQPELALAVLAYRRAFCAVRTQVDGGIKHRLLPYPDTVFDHGINGTTHRAMWANRPFDFNLGSA